MVNSLISIIVPIFRVEQYLRRCIESIINQTYKNLEIILVDDGSDDACPSICDEYSNKDKRIKVFHKKNGGLSDARNYGIDKSTGEYLVFIDSDDYINLTMIEKLYIELKNSNADISICPFFYVDEKDNILSSNKELSKKGIFTKEDIFLFFNVDSVSWILGVAWNKLYKREIFSDIRYPKGRLHEDDFVSFQIYDVANRIAIIDEKLYYYTQRNQSIMGNRFDVRHADGALASINRIEFALRTKRTFLIQKAEKQAFSVLFTASLNIKNKTDQKYLKPIILQYANTYKKICNNCKLSLGEKAIRTVLIKNGVIIKILRCIKRIKSNIHLK